MKFTDPTKMFTKFIFGHKIRGSEIPNSEKFWDDLSWPTQRGLKKILKSNGWNVEFSRDATNAYLNRVLADSDFVTRKGLVVGSLFQMISHLTKVVRFVPYSMLPIIDCRITNTGQAK